MVNVTNIKFLEQFLKSFELSKADSHTIGYVKVKKRIVG